MEITVATIFPSLFQEFLSEGIVARAIERGLVRVRLLNLREFTTDSYRTVDDYPYGGGPGMVMKAEPILRAVGSVTGTDFLGPGSGDVENEEKAPRGASATPGAGDSGAGGSPKPRIVILSPQGKQYDQEKADELSQCDSIVMICGRYKAIDERVTELLGAEEISIGDYVLSGGELAAMVVTESVVRLLPGAMEDEDSAAGDSFAEGILDCAYYTRPETVAGTGVPEVLLSGNHEAIRRWRRKSSLQRTLERRPELFENIVLSKDDRQLLEGISKNRR